MTKKKKTHGGRRAGAGRKQKEHHARLSAWIKTDQYEWLKIRAGERGISVSGLLEEIFQAEIQRHTLAAD